MPRSSHSGLGRTSLTVSFFGHFASHISITRFHQESAPSPPVFCKSAAHLPAASSESWLTQVRAVGCPCAQAGYTACGAIRGRRGVRFWKATRRWESHRGGSPGPFCSLRSRAVCVPPPQLVGLQGCSGTLWWHRVMGRGGFLLAFT